MYRLFISVNLPPDLLAALDDLQRDLKRQLGDGLLRWTRPEGIHLTLKFLGDTEPGRIAEITDALRLGIGAHPAFSVQVGGLGCFPNLRKPNVLWVDVADPDRKLQRLAAQVDRTTVGLGWPPEQRPFAGHLTLARVQKYARNEERQSLGERIAGLKICQDLGALPVAHIHLMRSQLDPKGSIYASLAEVELAGGR